MICPAGITPETMPSRSAVMSMPPTLTTMDMTRIRMPPCTASSENFQSKPAPATACAQGLECFDLINLHNCFHAQMLGVCWLQISLAEVSESEKTEHVTSDTFGKAEAEFFWLRARDTVALMQVQRQNRYYLPERLVQWSARNSVETQPSQVDESQGQAQQCGDLAPLILREPAHEH